MSIINRIRFRFINNNVRRAAQLLANGHRINVIVNDFNLSDTELGEALTWASRIEEARR